MSAVGPAKKKVEFSVEYTRKQTGERVREKPLVQPTVDLEHVSLMLNGTPLVTMPYETSHELLWAAGRERINAWKDEINA